MPASSEVVDEVYQLFIDLDANEEQIEFPIVYTNARAGQASLEQGVDGVDLKPLLDLLVSAVPAPTYKEGHGLQALVTNLDASAYVGRLALCRVHNGTIKKGQTVAWCRHETGAVEKVRVVELYITEGMTRTAAASAAPGDIIALAGFPEITIGDTIADADNPKALPPVSVDEPALGMTIGINTSPLAGKAGSKLTARQISDRLQAELVDADRGQGLGVFGVGDRVTDGDLREAGEGDDVPGAALAAAMRLMPSVMYSSTTRTFSTAPDS